VLYGAVVQVANDAGQRDNDMKKWVFTAQVTLSTDTILIEGRKIHLTPGMTVTAEIKRASPNYQIYAKPSDPACKGEFA
jgi:hemolysin D